MTKEEYTNLINEIISNPDTATVNAQKLSDAINADVDSLESVKSANAEYEKRIRDLQDTNIKLFLSQTETPKNKKNDDDNMSLSDFASKLVSTEREEK